MPELCDEWRERMTAHEARADALTADHLARRRRHEKHPVYDFLFEYYPIRPSHLRRWHPGLGCALPGRTPHADWRDYHFDGTTTAVDAPGLWQRRGESLTYIRDLLHRTTLNPAHFDCFGLHEWAMVYKTESPRHDLPLRLGAAGSDVVVEKHRIRCTHFDAYRFFTPAARPLNLTVLNRADQAAHDQAGCVHATMDLYKWASKLGALVPSELFLDCFELAVDARVLDMEASPYDCRAYGFGVVPIETSEGKAEYVERQRALAERGKPLRERLVTLIDAAAATTLVGHGPSSQ
ncbi:MAG: 3-methyladenine DNA glycosylase [Corynebacterium sp.]|uniref:3-methyladenine DNA glycosylase n=1 Tax=Corynebacterium sp. TaxID=1720 RepID=UPI0026DFA464|nr:3-methyladenine DNA glycosylase [Corynebacterium sp.]MDO5670587.1 3-methyladenine DNA glycosylase [Corynebacterium sp.]